MKRKLPNFEPPEQLSEVTKRLRLRETQSGTPADFAAKPGRDHRILSMIQNSINDMIDVYEKLKKGEENESNLMKTIRRVAGGEISNE